MPTDMNRRSFLFATCAAAMAVPAAAMTTNQAASLIDEAVGQITSIINSGKSESAMIADFERMVAKYGDMNYIAFKTLGPPARTASKAQMSAYKKAFQGYMARKYGKRFREFIGGKVVVKRAKAVKSFFVVDTTAVLKGRAPFNVAFYVSGKSGRDLFFDMRIEGVSLINSEKEEIGALLEKNRGNIDAMIADLRRSG